MNALNEGDKPEERMKHLEALEGAAWKVFEDAESQRDKVAALKAIADIILKQIRLEKELAPKMEVESVEFYEEEIRRLGRRVGLFSARRRSRRPDAGS